MRAVFLIYLVIAAVSARPQDANKQDDMNADDILAKDQLLMSYIKCTLEQGECSAEREKLKSYTKAALENICPKCTEEQRERIRRVIAHINSNGPDYWKQRMPTLVQIKTQQFF